MNSQHTNVSSHTPRKNFELRLKGLRGRIPKELYSLYQKWWEIISPPNSQIVPFEYMTAQKLYIQLKVDGGLLVWQEQEKIYRTSMWKFTSSTAHLYCVVRQKRIKHSILKALEEMIELQIAVIGNEEKKSLVI